jgi:hypothetical protein
MERLALHQFDTVPTLQVIVGEIISLLIYDSTRSVLWTQKGSKSNRDTVKFLTLILYQQFLKFKNASKWIACLYPVAPMGKQQNNSLRQLTGWRTERSNFTSFGGGRSHKPFKLSIYSENKYNRSESPFNPCKHTWSEHQTPNVTLNFWRKPETYKIFQRNMSV